MVAVTPALIEYRGVDKRGKVTGVISQRSEFDSHRRYRYDKEQETNQAEQ